MATTGKNQIFEIKNENGTSFHNLVLRKSTVESIVMSLGDKISGDVYYKDNTLSVTMHEYITYNGVNYVLVNPPTVVREGIVSDNSELKGMTKYSFEFYHPMYQLGNFPFCDVAVTSDETRYLGESKTFSWIGKPSDFVAKLNKNLADTEWIVEISSRFPQNKLDELSNVIQFDNATIADACKTFYDTWGVPYVVDKVASTEASYATGKRFKLVMGLPSNEIYENESARQLGTPYVFQMGQGVGLKNNSRTPRNNKIVTRIAGYGSEDNVPYGYPQIVWDGNQDWDYTINNDPDNPLSYPIYKGIVGGQYVKLIKHPFTRTHLMPSIFTEAVNKKVNPNADGYDPTIEIKDYYDAVATQEYPYVNEINLQAPSYESHEFTDIKPELDADRSTGIVSTVPLNSDLTPADHWDDTMDDDGNYLQSYFRITLPKLSFDLYACAAITQEMQINMRSGACIGCTFTVQVDWNDYKSNFYDEDGNFAPDGEQRDLTKYPKSNLGQISVVVQKDNSTFGTLMPNIYQQPKANDLFVFIGISLPLSYITNAEERLDDAMKTYMLENNMYYFDYPLKFDEHFLATHTYILEQIRPNSIIHFDYGGVEQQLFVKQLTVKYGNAPLPQYDITLTDNVEVVLNQIGQVAEGVEKLSTLIAILRQSYGKNVWNELSKKLSKVDNDIAYGDLDFRGHVTVGKDLDIEGDGSVEKDFRIGGRETVNELHSTEYTGDGLLDTGYRLWYEEGRAKLVIDDLVARGKFTVNELETRIWTYAGGNMIFSGAGSTIFYVEYLDANNNTLGYTHINQPWLLRGRALVAGALAWSKRRNIMRKLSDVERAMVVKFRCYEYSDDGTMQTRNWWHPNDIAMCQTFNRVKNKAQSGTPHTVTETDPLTGEQTTTTYYSQGSASNTTYKRRVAGVGSSKIPTLNDGRIYDYVDLWNIYDVQGETYIDTDGTTKTITDTVKGFLNMAASGQTPSTDWPVAGDVIVQCGNPLDEDRQSMVTIEVQGDVHGFKVYDTIDDYSMENTLWVEIGYDKDGGKAKANIFGDFRFGHRPTEQGSYISYNRTTGDLDVKAKINILSTIGDTALPDYVNAPVLKYAHDLLNGVQSPSGDAETAANVQHLVLGALNGGTFVDGGLLLTSLIGLRHNTGTAQNPNYVTYGGMNGVYDSTLQGKTIAAWFGGSAIDHEADVSAQNYAQSLLRFDGSGYLAGGNISWDESGNCKFAGEITAQSGTIGGFEIGATSLGRNSQATGSDGYTYITPDGKIKLWKSASSSDKTALDAYGSISLSAYGANETISINAAGGAKVHLNIDNSSRLIIDTPNNWRRTPSEVGEVYIDSNGFLKVQ